MKKILSIALSFMMLLSLAVPAFAASKMEAVTITLASIDGDGATITDKMGRNLNLRDGSRIVSGYTITTDSSTVVYLSLDSKTAVTIEKSTTVTIQKKGSKNEIFVESGNVGVNVTEKLEGSEELNIATSNMVMGVRGTLVGVSVTEEVTKATVYTGSTQVETLGNALDLDAGFMLIIGGTEAGDDNAPTGEQPEDAPILQPITREDVNAAVAQMLDTDDALSEEVAAILDLPIEEFNDVVDELIESYNNFVAEQQTLADEAKSAADSEGKTSFVPAQNLEDEHDDEVPSGPIIAPNELTTFTQAAVDAMFAQHSDVIINSNATFSENITIPANSSGAINVLRVGNGATVTFEQGITAPETTALDISGTVNLNGNSSISGHINVNSANSLYVNGTVTLSGAQGYIVVSNGSLQAKMVVNGKVTGGSIHVNSNGTLINAAANGIATDTSVLVNGGHFINNSDLQIGENITMGSGTTKATFTNNAAITSASAFNAQLNIGAASTIINAATGSFYNVLLFDNSNSIIGVTDMTNGTGFKFDSLPSGHFDVAPSSTETLYQYMASVGQWKKTAAPLTAGAVIDDAYVASLEASGFQTIIIEAIGGSVTTNLTAAGYTHLADLGVQVLSGNLQIALPTTAVKPVVEIAGLTVASGATVNVTAAPTNSAVFMPGDLLGTGTVSLGNNVAYQGTDKSFTNKTGTVMAARNGSGEVVITTTQSVTTIDGSTLMSGISLEVSYGHTLNFNSNITTNLAGIRLLDNATFNNNMTLNNIESSQNVSVGTGATFNNAAGATVNVAGDLIINSGGIFNNLAQNSTVSANNINIIGKLNNFGGTVTGTVSTGSITQILAPYKDEGNKSFYANGNAITIAAKDASTVTASYVDHNGAPQSIELTSDYIVYGGAAMQDVANTSVTMNGGTVKMIYGGGYRGNVTGNVTITVSGNSVLTGMTPTEAGGGTPIAGMATTGIMAGGINANINNATVTVNDTADVKAVVLGGTTFNDYQGNANAQANIVTLNMNGGTATRIFASGVNNNAVNNTNTDCNNIILNLEGGSIVAGAEADDTNEIYIAYNGGVVNSATANFSGTNFDGNIAVLAGNSVLNFNDRAYTLTEDYDNSILADTIFNRNSGFEVTLVAEGGSSKSLAMGKNTKVDTGEFTVAGVPFSAYNYDNLTGNWIISETTTITSDITVAAAKNVQLNNGATLHLNGKTLTIDEGAAFTNSGGTIDSTVANSALNLNPSATYEGAAANSVAFSNVSTDESKPSVIKAKSGVTTIDVSKFTGSGNVLLVEEGGTFANSAGTILDNGSYTTAAGAMGFDYTIASEAELNSWFDNTGIWQVEAGAWAISGYYKISGDKTIDMLGGSGSVPVGFAGTNEGDTITFRGIQNFVGYYAGISNIWFETESEDAAANQPALTQGSESVTYAWDSSINGGSVVGWVRQP